MERATLERAKQLESLIDRLDYIKTLEGANTIFIGVSLGDILHGRRRIISIEYKPLINKFLDFLKHEKIELEKELLEL